MQLPDANRLPVRCLAGALGRTTNSYKFYWLLAVLRHVQEGGGRVVAVDDLVARMVTGVWYPVCYFRLSFGKQDQQAQLVARVQTARSTTSTAPKTNCATCYLRSCRWRRRSRTGLISSTMPVD